MYGIIDKLKKSFKRIEFTDSIKYTKKILEEIDIILCYETSESFSFLQEIRTLSKDLPFVILSHDKFPSSPIQYIQENLSHYIQPNLTAIEVIYILEHALKNYDNIVKNLFMQSEHKAYMEILDSMVIISRTDLEGNITYANEVFCEISGYSKEELLGNNHNILRHPEMPKDAFRQMWSTIGGNKVWQGVVKNKTKQNDTYITKATISPYYNEKNIKVGYIGVRYLVTDDIVEKGKLKNYFTKKISELTQKVFSVQQEHLVCQKENEKLLKELRQHELFGGSTEALALLHEIEKNKKLLDQIALYEIKEREKDLMYEKRIEKFLEQKRFQEQLTTEKNRQISLLKNKEQEFFLENSSLKSKISQQDDQIRELTDEVEKYKDLLRNEEEKNIKLYKLLTRKK